MISHRVRDWEHIESLGSFVIEERSSNSKRLTDVDGAEPQVISHEAAVTVGKH
jgi:hypothetical protein